MKRAAVSVTLLSSVLLASACAAPEADLSSSPTRASMPEARADIRNAIGQSKAQATATQIGDSVRIRVTASGMPSGNYGAHVHAVGRCDAPSFETAGPHWNPTARQHGKNNPGGQHHGDLPNLAIGTGGSGSFEATIPAASLAGGGGGPMLLDADGAALVIHAKADDYRTDPSGNSGTRIACGVFR